jgi:hypothetical protein
VAYNSFNAKSKVKDMMQNIDKDDGSNKIKETYQAREPLPKDLG